MLYKIYNNLFYIDLDLSSFGLSPLTPPVKESEIVKISLEKAEPKSFANYINNQTKIDQNYGYYYSENIAFFEFFNGKELKINYFRSIDNNLIQTLLNYPIGSILFQRGFYVIHASAVKYNEEVICFIGSTMTGKSSLSAYLISKGASLISEDTCIFDINDNSVLLFPAYPFIKISDEIKQYTNLSQEDGMVFNKKLTNRRGYKISNNFSNLIHEVDYFIFLEWVDTNPQLIQLNPSESFELILKNNFFNSFSNKKMTDIFTKTSSLLKKIKFFKFIRKKELSSLDLFLKYYENAKK